MAVAACVALLAATAMALLPISGRTTTWTWAPTATDPTETAIELSAGAPAEIDASIPCQTIRQRSATNSADLEILRFAGSRELGLWSTGPEIWVDSSGTRIAGLTQPLGDGDCTVRLHYDGASDSVTLNAGRESRTSSVAVPESTVPGAVQPSFQIDGVHIAKELREGSSVRILTRPATIAWPAWRWLLLLVIGAAAVVVWRSSRRLAGPTGPVVEGSRSARWTLSDTGVALAALVALFFVPSLSDDGWVLTTARNYASLGFFSNYFTASAAPQPQGFWWTLIQQSWLRHNDIPLLVLRLPSLLMVVGGWWVLRRFLIDRVTAPSAQAMARGVAAAVVAAFVLAWLPSLRPEMVVSLLLVAQFLLILRIRNTGRMSLLLAVGVVAAAAFAVHQSGWVVVTASLAVVPQLLRWWRESSNRLSLAVFLAATAGVTLALVVGLLMLFSNLSVFEWSSAAFTSEGAHDQSFNELLRIQNYAVGQVPIRIFCLLLIGLSIGGFLVRRDRAPSSAATVLGYAAVLACVGLLPTSSKWIWHLAALWPAVAALAALAAIGLMASSGRWLVRGLTASAIVVVTGWLSSRYPGRWGRLDSWTVDLYEFTPARSPMFWLLLVGPVGVVLAVIFRLRRRGFESATEPSQGQPGTADQRPGVVLTVMAGLTVTVLASVSLAPMLSDALDTPANSWPGIVVGSVAGNPCGLAGPSGLRVPTQQVVLPFAEPEPVGQPAATAQPYLVDRVGSRRPVDSTTWTAPAGALSAVTPWFQVPADGDLRTWALPGTAGFELVVEWSGSTPPVQARTEFS
ncbi:MAG: arabinosyltransferase, partial [Actinomycetota bacterium]|nr:arabinosyltransferase [Actinomycetota bacterium]